jgi:hypothetical protein
MEDLKRLDMDVLVDLLSTQTSAYIQMHALGASKGEFKKTQLQVEAIQAEIKSRRQVSPSHKSVNYYFLIAK